MRCISRKVLAMLLVTVMALTVVLAGCAEKAAPNERKVIIGAKGFTNNIIPSEILAQLIEAKTDIKVQREFELATALIQPAILNGEVDLYPEYTGTGLLVALQMDPIFDRQEVYDTVKEEYARRYNITWTAPLGHSDGYGLAVRRETAEEYNLRTFSDLAEVSDQLVFGAEFDFYERPEGYDLLAEAYGFNFKKTEEMDGALKYQAIGEGIIDVVVVYEVDGLIGVLDLQVLEDDQEFFVPYDTAFIIRDEVKEKYPEIMEIIDSLAGKIGYEDIIRMNAAVDSEGRDIAAVAAEFIEEKGLR